MFFRAFFSLKTFPCTVTKVDEPVVPHHNQRSPNTPRQDQVQNTECTAFIIYQAFEPRNGGHALEPHLNRSNGSTNGPNSNQPNPWQAGVGLAPPACAHLALSTLARSPFAPPHSTLRYPQQPDRPWHSKCAQYRSTCQKFGLQTNECSHTRGEYSYPNQYENSSEIFSTYYCKTRPVGALGSGKSCLPNLNRHQISL